MNILKYVTSQGLFFYLNLFLIIFTIVTILYILYRLSFILKSKREIVEFKIEQNKVIKNKENLRKMNERARIRKRKNYW